MNRADLMAPEAMRIVDDLNLLIRRLYSSGVSMTSWYGTVREKESGWRSLLGRLRTGHLTAGPIGMDNRGPDYRDGGLPGRHDVWMSKELGENSLGDRQVAGRRAMTVFAIVLRLTGRGLLERG